MSALFISDLQTGRNTITVTSNADMDRCLAALSAEGLPNIAINIRLITIVIRYALARNAFGPVAYL
jgi:hypothetical protein